MTSGVRTVLVFLAALLGALGTGGLLLGFSSGRPAWGVAGLVALLYGLALVRSAATRSTAQFLEPWTGVVAVGGGMVGLLTQADGPSTLSALEAVAWIGVGVVAYVAGRYAVSTDSVRNGPTLEQWMRFTVWAVGIVALDQLLAPLGAAVRGFSAGLTAGMLLLAIAVGVERIAATWRGWGKAEVPAIDSTALRWVFGRWNPVASVGDALQATLGVDLRTTWALQFLRAAVAPMAIGVVALGWLCTTLVRVGPEEVAIHERLGRPLSRDAVGPGLHIVLPWPIDRLRRVAVKRVLTMSIGEEEHGEEEDAEEGHQGPEDTLWARMHAEEEYTLLLGDGRDLVTLDGLLQYRIADPYTYLYGAQNPEEGLRAAAYEALTRRTVGRSLDAVLSENLATFAEEVVADVRARSEDLDLGLEPVSFTLKGLHPPFAVAKDYQAVVSAQIAQTTSVIRARAYRMQQVPDAQAAAMVDLNDARAVHLTSRAIAVGEAEAFRGLVESYGAAPELFRFRRRMETLEANLAERNLTILDRRFEAQGGQLWLLK